MNLKNYGAKESNPIDKATLESQLAASRTVDWTEPDLYITRLRLLSDPGFPAWDVSYCYGRIKATGEVVRVELPFSQLPKGGKLTRAIVEYAKKDGVYARGIGILDNISCLS